jgi:uncharacterized membrane protein YtjA (UPF0391 family)
MMRFRVSIAALMAAVLVAAIGFAALTNPSAWWSSILFTLTLALFLIATVGAIRGGNKTFWLGFALFGWSYMIVSYEPWSKHATTPPPLVTIGLLNRLYPHISTVPPDEVLISGTGVWKDSRSIEVASVAKAGGIRFFRNDMSDFLQVGHFLASWLFAFLGGMTASRLFLPPSRGDTSNLDDR